MAVFTQSGLVSIKSWSVTFNGQTKTTTGGTLAFAIVNGTYQSYSYTIKTVAGYSTLTENGSFAYQGAGSRLQ